MGLKNAFSVDVQRKQITSDCYIDNRASEGFHKSCGFVEKERVICFVKEIGCSE